MKTNQQMDAFIHKCPLVLLIKETHQLLISIKSHTKWTAHVTHIWLNDLPTILSEMFIWHWNYGVYNFFPVSLSLSACVTRLNSLPLDLHVRKIRSFNYTFHIWYLNTENIQRIIAFDNFIGLNCIAMHWIQLKWMINR